MVASFTMRQCLLATAIISGDNNVYKLLYGKGFTKLIFTCCFPEKYPCQFQSVLVNGGGYNVSVNNSGEESVQHNTEPLQMI